jgi:hypothetical protein
MRFATALTLPENVVFLGGRETLLRDGVLFVGACAWWDFAFCAPEREPEEARKHFRRAACEELCVPPYSARRAFRVASRSCASSSLAAPFLSWFNAPPADGTPVDAVLDALAAADFAHVAAAVTAAQDDPSVHAIVVLTHTVPHRELLRKGVYPRSLLDAAFYGSSLSERVPALDVRRKIAFWCYGHSHVGGDAHVGDGHVRYLSHPRGRPDDFNRVSYAPLLLELRVAAGEAPQLSVLPQAGDAPAEDVAAAGPRRKQTQHR